MKLSLTLLIDIPENSLFDKNNSEEVIEFLEDTLSPKNLKLKSKNRIIGTVESIKDITEL